MFEGEAAEVLEPWFLLVRRGGVSLGLTRQESGRV